MAKADMLEVEGVVTEALPNATFEVELQNGHKILAHLSGKLRMNYIRVLPGDKVSFDSESWANDKAKEVVLWRRGDTCDFVIMYVGTHVAGLEE